MDNNKKTKTDIKDVQLNIFIFKDISIDLVKNSKFKEILELSLLSKLCFKIIQNTISDESGDIFQFKLSKFINYITNIEESDDSSIFYNNYTLVQYKKLKSIYAIQKRINEFSDYYDYKNIFNKYCPLLKIVYFDNPVRAQFYSKFYNSNYGIEQGGSNHFFEYDPTFGSFYKFKKILLHWGHDDHPISNSEEEENHYEVNAGGEYDTVEYSFDFLKYYMPKKVFINTNRPYQSHCKYGTDYYYNSLHLTKLENILNCKSIQSIDFGTNNLASTSFFKKALLSPNINSLSIGLFYDEYLQKCNSELFSLKDIEANVLEYLKEYLPTNNVLKKLNLKSCEHGLLLKDPIKFLESFKGNSNLRSLGLSIYDFKSDDFQLVETLLNRCPNLKRLYCKRKDITLFLEYTRKYPKIKYLTIENNKEDYKSIEHCDDEDIDIPELSRYIKENENSNLKITINCCFPLQLQQYNQFVNNNKQDNIRLKLLNGCYCFQ